MIAHRIIKLICYLSLTISLSFAAIWIRSYWYDTFLGYEARVTSKHLNHHYWIATSPGLLGFTKQLEALNPSFQREQGIWNFHDQKHEPPMDVVIGAQSKPSFLGFSFWTVESPNSYHYAYTWIPLWFLVTLFAAPTLWLIGSIRKTRKKLCEKL
jgi:hypothetical protein